MTRERFQEDEERLAKNLKRIWDDSDFQGLWVDVTSDIQAEWRLTDDYDQRERCHAEMRALDKLQQKFRALMGALAD